MVNLYGPPSMLRGSPAFRKLVRKLEEMHEAKSHEYGSEIDPLANLRAAAQCGVEPWQFALACCNEGMCRMKQHVTAHHLKPEKVQDILLDMASFSLLAALLIAEKEPPEPESDACVSGSVSALPVGELSRMDSVCQVAIAGAQPATLKPISASEMQEICSRYD